MNSLTTDKKLLWKAAIKWPLYSVAIMPILLAFSWKIGTDQNIRFDQFFGFLFASILLLIWENLTNDLFDADTGIDELKFHSLVQLLGNKKPVRRFATLALCLGLILIYILALKSSMVIMLLVFASCSLGYLYQGPPFRLGYKGLGEPLCWLAFGPLATAASLIVITPKDDIAQNIPWETALWLGAGPALSTTLVLFCSHFHQVIQDAKHGKRSPLVWLGTEKAAELIPWLIGLIFSLEIIPIALGKWPLSSMMGLIGLPAALQLIDLLKKHHNQPELISGCKFLALRFQTLNGIGLCIGFAFSPLLGIDLL